MLNISKRTVLRDIEKLKQKINWAGQVVKKADTGKLYKVIKSLVLRVKYRTLIVQFEQINTDKKIKRIEGPGFRLTSEL